MKQWFDGYEEILTELGIKDLLSHLGNCDETGLQDHFVTPTVVVKVRRACDEVTAGDEGETTAALSSFNALADYMPLLGILKTKRLKDEWLYQEQPNTLVRRFRWWITSELVLDLWEAIC